MRAGISMRRCHNHPRHPRRPAGLGRGRFQPAIRDRNRVAQAWSDVDVQLLRRHDLIPRLVEMSKGTQATNARCFRTLPSYAGEALPRRPRRVVKPENRREWRHETRGAGRAYRSQGQRQLRPHNKLVDAAPDPVRAPLLQRCGESAEQPHPALSGSADRQHLGFKLAEFFDRRPRRRQNKGGAGMSFVRTIRLGSVRRRACERICLLTKTSPYE